MRLTIYACCDGCGGLFHTLRDNVVLWFTATSTPDKPSVISLWISVGAVFVPGGQTEGDDHAWRFCLTGLIYILLLVPAHEF